MVSARTTSTFSLLEPTVGAVHRAFESGELSARELVQAYLDRIEAYDRGGPALNSIITVHPEALQQAEERDQAYASSGPVGPLHGIPIVLKDQMDALGTPTTLGSVLLADHHPTRDAFVADKLKAAGGIILAKATLGELGGGDAHGTLFGSTCNPYDVERTCGGSSGGTGAAVSANLATLGVGQEGMASIRRPSAWNNIAGMRPTAGLVSRGGVFDGWPGIHGSLGPMSRTVHDLAVLLDVMAGYDPEDPLTAMGARHIPGSFTDGLEAHALQGARIGVLRQSLGRGSEPDSEDYRKVAEVFDRAVGDLAKAGAVLVDPVEIPDLHECLAKRSGDRGGSAAAFDAFFARNGEPPFASYREFLDSPDYAPRSTGGQIREATSLEHHVARETLMFSYMKVMEDHRLDALVHQSVEHQPTLLSEGTEPPFVNIKGATHLNTFLVYMPAISVPAGFTTDDLPAGIDFYGRPYSDAALIRLAYAYEQATRHRRAPATTPALPAEP